MAAVCRHASAELATGILRANAAYHPKLGDGGSGWGVQCAYRWLRVSSSIPAGGDTELFRFDSLSATCSVLTSW